MDSTGGDPRNSFDVVAEDIAREIHTLYEKYAPDFISRRPSRVIWERLPSSNKVLMTAVVKKLLIDGKIEPGKNTTCREEVDQAT